MANWPELRLLARLLRCMIFARKEKGEAPGPREPGARNSSGTFFAFAVALQAEPLKRL